MKVTSPGKRYYSNEIEGFAEAKAAVRVLCDAKIRAYNNQYRRTYEPDGFDDPQKGKKRPVYEDLRSFGLTATYANALEPYVTGTLKSQASNLENYISKLDDDIDSMYGKLNTLGEELVKKLSLKESLKRYLNGGEWESPYPKCTVHPCGDGKVTGYHLDPIDAHLYEHKTDRAVRKLRRRMSSIFEGILRREQKKAKLESGKPTKAIFGSRALFRKKDTVCKTGKDVREWKEEFDFARHSSVTLAGRGDSTSGNFIMHWDGSTHKLTWKLPDGGKCVFPDFMPVNHAGTFRGALVHSNFYCNTVSYTVDLRKGCDGREYFLVWATFTLKEDPYRNYSLDGGVISADINADHIAFSNLEADGTRADGGVIPMDLAGKTSDQAADIIGRTVAILITECELACKPLVVENLDSRGMYRKQRYGNKKKNRTVSQFAFQRVLDTIHSRAARCSVEVLSVNPAYTSFAGKVSRMRDAGISVHEAASWMIGLVGLGLYPEVPEQYRGLTKRVKPTTGKGDSVRPLTERERFYRMWRAVYCALSSIRTHAFYLEVPALPNKRAYKAWFKEHDIYCPKASRGG